MSNISNVPFWLEVKKEYVVENFDKLLDYLSACSSHPEAIGDINDVNSDFNRTCYVLKQVADEYLETFRNIKLYESLDEKNIDIVFAIRVISAYLLSCNMANKSDYEALAVLTNVLVAANTANTMDRLQNLQEVVVKCMSRNTIVKYGFGWNEVKQLSDSKLELFCAYLGNTVFEQSDKSELENESNGLLILGEGKLRFSPLNRQKLIELKKRNKLATQFDLPTLEIINSSKECININDFEALKKALKGLSLEQHNYTPSPVVNKKTYDCSNGDDDIIVRVTRKSQRFFDNKMMIVLSAETVDPAYEKLQGDIYVKTDLHGISYDMFVSNVSVGSFLKVRLQNRDDMPFSVDATFEKFYEDYVLKCNNIVSAIYLKDSKHGRKWLASDGVIVSTRTKEENSAIDDAIEYKQIVNIRVYERKADKNGNYIANGSFTDPLLSDEFDDVTEDEFVEQAYLCMLNEFVDYSSPEFEIKEDEVIEKFDSFYLNVLIPIYYRLGNRIQNSRDRYSVLYTSLILAEFLGDIDSADYINMELRYQNALVDFARGATPKLIAFEPEPRFASLEQVKKKVKIVECINNYDDTDIPVKEEDDKYLFDDQLYENIDELVNSSNRLNGKIHRPELNRIKKSIANYLKVEDEYVNITSDITYYGEESDTLEFKSSIIYSAKDSKHYSPSQIWDILKAMCAFMNTITGGEILLGVRDNGYPCGLNNDLEYMYKNGMISEITLDRYRGYIKMMADKVFVDDNDMSKGKEITTGRVMYIIEKTKEGYDVLHIQVRPYEYGLVHFDKSVTRPDGISQSYIRRSGDSIIMTSELSRQAKQRKLNASYDGNLKKFIALQKACKDGKAVRIINYTSHRGKRDIIAEPYQPIPEHNAFLVYDVDEKDIMEYKITRMEDVVVLDKAWTNTKKHKIASVDLFGFVEKLKTKPVYVELKLQYLPYSLLKEEYKDASKYLYENLDASDKEQYPWLLKTTVNDLRGIGRFYLGLAELIKIEKGEALKKYTKEYIGIISQNI